MVARLTAEIVTHLKQTVNYNIKILYHSRQTEVMKQYIIDLRDLCTEKVTFSSRTESTNSLNEFIR